MWSGFRVRRARAAAALGWVSGCAAGRGHEGHSSHRAVASICPGQRVVPGWRRLPGAGRADPRRSGVGRRGVGCGAPGGAEWGRRVRAPRGHGTGACGRRRWGDVGAAAEAGGAEWGRAADAGNHRVGRSGAQPGITRRSGMGRGRQSGVGRSRESPGGARWGAEPRQGQGRGIPVPGPTAGALTASEARVVVPASIPALLHPPHERAGGGGSRGRG